MRRLVLSILASAAALIWSAHANEARAQTLATYSITVVRASDPSLSVRAIDLNNRGEIVVNFDVAEGQRAGVWRAGKIAELPRIPNAMFSQAVSINDSGEIAGLNLTAPEDARNVLWIDDQPLDLGTPTPGIPVHFQYVNNRRQFSLSSNGIPYRWDDGAYTQLILPRGVPSVSLADINNRGTILGWGQTPTGARPLLWNEDGSFEVLGGLPGTDATTAAGINDRREVVGFAVTPAFLTRAFVWRGGQFFELPFLQPGGSNEAHAINFWGQIVGIERSADRFTRTAVIWHGGRAFDLHTRIRSDDPSKPFVTLLSADRINDWGQILAEGVDSRFPDRGFSFLLTPTR